MFAILNGDENYEAKPIVKPIRKWNEPPDANNVSFAMHTL
jgi:hypothetical protein